MFECNPARLTDDFAVQIDGDDHEANRLALQYNFANLGMVIPGYYHFRNKRLNRRSVTGDELTVLEIAITSERTVLWIEPQKVKRRVKRDYKDIRHPVDPLYDRMWYLNPSYPGRNDPIDVARGDLRHLNVSGVWAEGYSGKGVTITTIDDGMDWTHPDLVQNYDPLASYDFNDYDTDPMPRYITENDHIDFDDPKSFKNPNQPVRLSEEVTGFTTEPNNHGTRCAGEIAAQRDNGICIPGIAFNAKIGGIRILDGDITDVIEASAIGFRPDHVDIYSSSWGPPDDGETVRHKNCSWMVIVNDSFNDSLNNSF